MGKDVSPHSFWAIRPGHQRFHIQERQRGLVGRLWARTLQHDPVLLGKSAEIDTPRII